MAKVVVFGQSQWAELAHFYLTHDSPHEVVALPCGHYSSGVAPFNFLDAYVLTRFLRQRL